MRSMILALLACATLTWTQPPATQAPAGVLALPQIAGTAARLQVTSPDIKAAGVIPLRHSDYGEKVSPELHWGGVPAAAKSLALLMEDPDAQEPKPFVHWLLYNLPPSIQMLPQAVSPTPRLKELGGALQGRNSRGSVGYFGPRPPKPDPPHHYHFQVFALDTMLTLDPGANREELLKAMTGHVAAAGELVGGFKAPPDAK